MPNRTEDAARSQVNLLQTMKREHTKSAMFARNRYLVDNADVLLAAYDGQPGGTQMKVKYARQMGIQVCCIRPVVNE